MKTQLGLSQKNIRYFQIRVKNLTWYVITETDGGESDKGEVEAVQVGPAVLDVPEDDGRNDHEDDKPGNDVSQDLKHQQDDVLQIVAAFAIFSIELWKLKCEGHLLISHLSE